MDDLMLTIIDDEITTVDDQSNDLKKWKIAIIDDDQGVHDVTKLALSGVKILGRKIEFISALSGEEGRLLLKDNPDCAVILLDVVMETSDAGLELADKIRNELLMDNVQIILRTGQPGYSPEEEIISRYEINDYKTKNELTRDKLFTSIATAIRSYNHLRALDESKKGLRNVIEASASLMKERSVHDFASGVLQQINALFNLSSQGIFCVSQSPSDGPIELIDESDSQYFVVATSPSFHDFYGKDLQDISNSHEVEIAQNTLINKQNQIQENLCSLYLSTPSGWEGVVVINSPLSLNEVDEELLKLFCLNISLGLENAKFFTHLNNAAFYDEVTGLYNRTGFIEKSSEILKSAKSSMALFIVDIDYFHEIIESLGFEFGNMVLNAVTSSLNRDFLSDGIIARLHSDVFALLLPDTNWHYRDITKECSKPFMIEGNSLRLGVTVGEATCDLSTETFDIELLLRHAEIALKVAKEHQRGVGQLFESKFEDDKRAHLDILADLRNGIANEELFLVLQPKVSMTEGYVVGYEALIRWQHPIKGLISPNAFIPVAEQSGLYFDIDMYVFRKALALIAENPAITKPISVNVSANSLHHSDFISELKKIIAEKDSDISQIEIEITENALVRSDMAIQHLRELKALGFVLCLDDFGAGYSSLSYLLKLPLDVIKIDRSFVTHIEKGAKALFVLEGMLQICQNLSMRVVVEGVETQEQADILIALNADIAQGFFYFKPLTIEEVLIKAL
ncbi:bifunctional diguanylate cyclase/phosphodiesterase [Psychromonas sp. Urea-02u-13]|uniref:bifunctional diguanylate cyclase/phosphodiesterase n=1 Tax=Psychromonas sp. Urea-02u-13 TaxID=2058326 RepID=UPI000C3384B5|nr:EAL domain-containing protein [Psychromonas sp. Urea-02u-13]PKG39965.1 diguanylate phosphodiesterase [Psychromonas sp. Urea-02u-13]